MSAAPFAPSEAPISRWLTDPLGGPLDEPIGQTPGPADEDGLLQQRHALAREITELFSYAPAAAFGSALGAVVMLVLFGAHTSPQLLWPWLIASVLLWLMRVGQAWRWRTADPQQLSLARLQRWLRHCIAMTLASGALWGVSMWVFHSQTDPESQAVLVIIIYSYCVAAVPVLGHRRLVFTSYLVLAFLPVIVRVAWTPTPHGPMLAGVLVLVLGAMMVLARAGRKQHQRAQKLKVRSERLMVQLREQTRLSEQARQAAEVANRAKTRFFAAASHDLRQPLHAMGLFAEALRRRVGQDPEVLHLVHSINSSVDALEGLFSELLDITRIDSGGVAARPEHVSVAAVFDRLRLHFEPLAFEKGLALRFRGGQHHVFADPVLLERVLRNLVSNAIRYTEDGGVLVGARRRGEFLRLEVWDSGVGIAPHEQSAIFEEFYQVEDGRPAGHQRAGLGLGLAIVQRLTQLMGASLGLRSQPGQGSLFTLSLPLGQAPRRPAVPPAAATVELTLARRLVVVVEDDPAVRQGLVLLLEGWQASVVAFDSWQACQQWLTAVEPSQIRPDLLMVDYRLEAGRTGLEVIRLLRQTFGRKLPAVMVTGSLDPGHELHAREHDYHLLLKPVLPHKLRAMVAFKLGLR